MEIKLLKKKTDEAKKSAPRYSVLTILISFLAALLLWFFVQDAEAPDYKRTFTGVELELQSLSSSFSVIDGGESRVDITLVGKRSDLNKLKESDLVAYVDLSFITRPGTFDAPVGFLVPEGMEMASCFPQNVTLFVDQTVSKSVPVKVELGSFTVAEDVVLEADPAADEITVKGPKTVLDKVSYAAIRTGDLGEITVGFESNLPYVLCDEDGGTVEERHLTLPERNMRVKLSVLKTRRVELRVVGKNGYWNEDNMKFTVSPTGVLVKGDPSAVDALPYLSITVDETGVDANQISRTMTSAALTLPEGIRLAETLGDIIYDVTLPGNVSRTMRMNLNATHVIVTPPAVDSVSYTVEEPALSFKIRGRNSDVYAAALDDFYLNIDLSSFTVAGEYTVPVEIVQTTASQGKYYVVGSYSVRVTLS